ncbi:MAG: glycosyltransferase [Gammaproteobacteria bacterium]
MKQMKPYRLALVVIARNEASCIRNCLDSASGHVDRMIVLDTGSTDDTVAIAGRCGATVHRFDWIDDFAAARNAALEYSNADWNLVLDADEQLTGGLDRLGADTLGKEPFIGVIPVTSEFDLADGVETATSWLPRILPAGVRYQGRIHEQPVSDLPRARLPVRVSHAGYRQAQLKQKAGRNRTLLLKMLEESPNDAYLLYQTGKDCEVYQEFDEAVRYYERALKYAAPTEKYRHDLVLRLIYSLKRAGQLERGIQLAELEMPNWPQSPDFFFALGDLLLDWATRNPQQAVQDILPMVESSWNKCLEIGEQPEMEGAVQGRGSFLAAHNLAVLYDGLGDAQQAAHYRKLSDELRSRHSQTGG